MLLNNSIGGTKKILKAAASREQTSTIPSVRGGGGGLGALANLKKRQNITRLAKCSIQMGWGRVALNLPVNNHKSFKKTIYLKLCFNLLKLTLPLVRLPAGLSQKSHSLTFKIAIHDMCDKTILCLSSEV